MISEIQKDYQEAIEQEAMQNAQVDSTQTLESTQESNDENPQDSKLELFERIESLSNACNTLLEDFENLAEHTMDLIERMDNVEKNGVKTQEAESSVKTSDDNFVYIDKLIKDDTLEREKAMKEEILQAIKANQPKKKSNSAQNIINFLVIFGIIVCLFLITKNQNTGATNGSTNNSSSSKNSTKNIRSK